MPPQLTESLGEFLDNRFSRRAFLRFCAATTALLALPAGYAPQVAAALTRAPRIPLVWLRGAGCGGNSEAFLRAANPGISELLLESLSIDYMETLMAPSGAAAEASRTTMRGQFPNGYIAVVEGAVSTADDGVFHTVGGRAFRDVVREVCDGALATIAVGSCAFDGGLAAASGGRTGAVGVAQVVANPRFVALPGCPANVANLSATIVHFLTFKALPPTDARGRPLFAYGSLLHNLCERRPHFEFGEFVLAWGDEGAQKGWCLYKMGCKGPQAFANCPTARYDEGVSWPVQAGHGCIGCTMPNFWDSMGPAYARLPSWFPFNPDVSADAAGIALVGGVAALAVGHGAASVIRARRHPAAAHAQPRSEAAASPTLPAEGAASPAQPPLEATLEPESGLAPVSAPVSAPLPAPEAALPRSPADATGSSTDEPTDEPIQELPVADPPLEDE